MSTVIHTAEYYSDRKACECPICKKMFIPAIEHAWQIGNWGNDIRYTDVCSYTCMRKWEKEQIENDKGKNQALLEALQPKLTDPTVREIAGLYLGSGYKVWKIAEIMGLRIEEILRYMNDIEDLISEVEEAMS